MRRLPEELGDLVEVHRPMRGHTGWLPILLMPEGFGLFAAVEDLGPLIGLLIYLGTFVPLMYGTSEWFLVEQRIYRHGIVFRSLVPGMKTYVVFYSCDITSFGTIGRRVHDGTDIDQMVGRQFRYCPMTAPTSPSSVSTPSTWTSARARSLGRRQDGQDHSASLAQS